MAVPYKRHESDTIACGLAEDVPPEEDCCPAETSTVCRWKHWFMSSHILMEEALGVLQKRRSSSSRLILPLYPLSRQRKGWLKLLVHTLVNSGFWDIPISHGNAGKNMLSSKK